jgi:hypothetical protein
VGFEDGYRVSKVVFALLESSVKREPVVVQYD